MKYILHIWFLIGIVGSLIGQSDTLDLAVVEIHAPAIRSQNLGSPNQRWDKATLQQLPVHSLADLLQWETGTFIKSYGLGSLATSSIRGAGASHSLILWNGIPITSPMLGQLDLSLIPTATADQIQFRKGGSSSQWGSGAIGGVISLEHQANYESPLSVRIHSEGGSFGHFLQRAEVGIGTSSFQSKTHYSFQSAQNNFFYSIREDLPEKQQHNAQLKQTNILQDLSWKVSPIDQLSLHLWYQDSFREIPPTSVQNRSEAYQEDQSTRSVLSWKRVQTHSLLQAKVAYFHEDLTYYDPLIGLSSPSQFNTWAGDLSYQKQIGEKHQLTGGGTFTYYDARSNGYPEPVDEQRMAVFAGWNWREQKWQGQVSLRQEWVAGRSIPLLPNLGLEYQLNPSLRLLGKVSRNYRLPTLNDRFWSPGGNPDLLPESGWSQELTVETLPLGKEGTWKFSLTGFNRNIRNWILWSIPEVENYWAAQNIAEVWSRGIESQVQATFPIPDGHIRGKLGYDWIRSTNQIGLEFPSIAKGEQLWYTPIHQASGHIQVNWNHLSLHYAHTYTGASEGINELVGSYQLGSLRLNYEAPFLPLQNTLFLNIHNLWNEDYVVIERRPMPGIHAQVGIQLFFQHTPKSNL